jgi:hypothetical protein
MKRAVITALVAGGLILVGAIQSYRQRESLIYVCLQVARQLAVLDLS